MVCEQSTWVRATSAKSAKAAPLKAVTLADCSLCFFAAKVPYFYWQTDTFIFEVLAKLFMRKKKSKQEEILTVAQIYMCATSQKSSVCTCLPYVDALSPIIYLIVFVYMPYEDRNWSDLQLSIMFMLILNYSSKQCQPANSLCLKPWHL